MCMCVPFSCHNLIKEAFEHSVRNVTLSDVDLDQTTKTELNNVSGVLLHSACVQCSSKRVSSSVSVFAVVSVGKAKQYGMVRVGIVFARLHVGFQSMPTESIW